MKFGPVPLADALGAILAHSAEAADPAVPASLVYKIAKGTVLTPEHLRDLAANDISDVTVARLESGDVHEDEAATHLAAALLRDGCELSASKAATGRVNLRASASGLVKLDADRINAVNLVHPGLTVATVADYHRLDARGLVATVKIIPYAVPRAALEQACDLAQDAIGFLDPVLATATLIETEVPGQKDSPKGRRAVEARLNRLGVMLSPRVMVPHRIEAIAAALAQAPGELVLILTGSATSDPHDTAPEGLRRAGGALIHYGMPVDPGNLLFQGDLSGRPVIGLPGCARSPALNGADWVLERVICGSTPEPRDIMGLGVGGLLKDIPTRPLPRRRIEPAADTGEDPQ